MPMARPSTPLRPRPQSPNRHCANVVLSPCSARFPAAPAWSRRTAAAHPIQFRQSRGLHPPSEVSASGRFCGTQRSATAIRARLAQGLRPRRNKIVLFMWSAAVLFTTTSLPKMSWRRRYSRQRTRHCRSPALRPASRSRLLKRCRANNVRGVQRCGMPPLPPGFLDLFITQDLRCVCLGSVHSEGVAGGTLRLVMPEGLI
jgi:hypothetical protein